MKWHKFLIWFALFLGAVMNFFTGIQAITGDQYDGKANLVYSVFDGLESMDMFMGIACIALAVFGIVVRFCLSGYKSVGPKLLVALYLAGTIIPLIYLIGVNSILSQYTSDSLDFSSTVPSLVTSAAMAFVNLAYYKKRSHLFVN